ncbi:hypothetical protein [Candidatus Nitrospira inopinata]|jgi:hypothetical protein|uniref:Uncharacterized protein n=1 Tax=Candidatus Nitrospira inopinata TaxID=1715989 RepID=A0A0S4KRY3_9BACT|nr:hypothetical protein [Candidatus Nitrospira inopinata]MCP9461766.1 hypothetical protein [Nitrospira sp.]MCP9472408.1 hypothetical protein [Nitrospira sp.]CUQ66511.1 protein of unknown function [Candidatus Nitrospira inopinata]
MSALNWVGIVMLILALFFNELFLGINAWYELNTGAIIAAIVYLIAGVTLSLWPTPSDDQA